MASKTYIYRDMVSGCEMFSVAHPHHLMAGNDAVICVQSAMINENGDPIDVGGGGNHFGGEESDATPLARLPDGYSQIFRSYALGPSGLKNYCSATLRYKI